MAVMIRNGYPEKHIGFSVGTDLRLTIAIPSLLSRPVRLRHSESCGVGGRVIGILEFAWL
ncbi:MAG: hypothetical protein EHM41_23070 [Chloroflexi bacterium]|nr:MAG: hypothetical protein EHM41_23070 [Chloroflexota bacterium]